MSNRRRSRPGDLEPIVAEMLLDFALDRALRGLGFALARIEALLEPGPPRTIAEIIGAPDPAPADLTQ